jgi:pilus assembly protein TadC
MTEIQGTEIAESKFMRVFLTLISALLIFAGPTYIPYILEAIGLAYIAAIVLGVALFAVGLFMLFYLYRKKIIN